MANINEISQPKLEQGQSARDSHQFEDNQTIADKLGILNPVDLFVERFQIDRFRLQKLHKSHNTESYFHGIMDTTKTYIYWPREFDFRSKIDPYIEVFGTQNSVLWAKEIIAMQLRSKGSQLKLKMVISNVDHYFIAGNGSEIANDIITRTNTNIQLPDFNQKNVLKKNNQVSICGCLEDMKEARRLLRSSAPLLMSFEVPADQPTPPIMSIQDDYGVQVILCPNLKLNTSLIRVKGTDEDKVKQATILLINATCGPFAKKPSVSLQVEVPPPYHDTIRGQSNANLATIMESTQTKIFFPDLSLKLSMRQKSRINITGTIEGVLHAREIMLGNLPIELTFDIPVEKQGNATEIMNLGTKLGVLITLSQKEMNGDLAVTIKAPEKYTERIYEIYKNILQTTSYLPIESDLSKTIYSVDGSSQGALQDEYTEQTQELYNQRTDFLQNPLVESPYVPNYHDQGQYQITYSSDPALGIDNTYQEAYQTYDWIEGMAQLNIQQTFEAQYPVQFQSNDWVYQGVAHFNPNESFEAQYAVQPEVSHTSFEGVHFGDGTNVEIHANNKSALRSEQWVGYEWNSLEAPFYMPS